MANVLIYTEGGEVGLGHVVRCIHLANALTMRGVEAKFDVPASNAVGIDRVRKAGYSLFPSPHRDTIIVDVEQYPGLDNMRYFRENYRRVVLIGGVSYPPAGELGEYVDLTVYQGELFDAPESDKVLNGPRYLIIDPRFSECKPDPNGPIVVSMGGRDPFDMTDKIQDHMMGLSRDVTFVIGPAYSGNARWINYEKAIFTILCQLFEKEIDNKTGPEFKYVIVKNSNSLVPYLDGASLAIVTTGMTAYEALAARVPALLYNISPDHERTARELHERGAAVNMGLCIESKGDDLTKAIGRITPELWRNYSRAGGELVDGLGAGRVADRIMELAK